MPAASLRFHWATLDDVAEVVALVQRAYRGEASRAGWTTEADLLDGQRTDAEEVRGQLASERRRLLVGSGVGGLVACAALTFEPPDTAYLGMICVEPSAQGEGLGRALLCEAERRAAVIWPVTRARMTVIEQRDTLIRWYERRGYARTGEREPFPYGQPRFGVPRRDDLGFVVLAKSMGAQPG